MEFTISWGKCEINDTEQTEYKIATHSKKWDVTC